MGGMKFNGPLHAAVETVRAHGVRGLYRGYDCFLLFAAPRAAAKFSAFEAMRSTMDGLALRSTPGQRAVSDTVCGLGAGVVEAALCQTPNQAISTKMLHDQSLPAEQRRFRGLSVFGAARAIHAESGFFGGFYCGVAAAVTKGAMTNMLRFPIFGACKRALQGGEQPAAPRRTASGHELIGDATPAAPLPPLQAIAAGAFAGAISALVTQPVDTIMGNMQGLESGRYTSMYHCARTLVDAGGFAALYNGIGPRLARVTCEVGLQFALFEQVSPLVDRWLAPR